MFPALNAVNAAWKRLNLPFHEVRRIGAHLLKKFIMENLIFCAVYGMTVSVTENTGKIVIFLPKRWTNTKRLETPENVIEKIWTHKKILWKTFNGSRVTEEKTKD